MKKHIIRVSIFLILISGGGLAGCESPYNRKAWYDRPIQTADYRREKYIKNHPFLSQEVENKIRWGQISIGMTKEQVRASWGKPDDKNQTITEDSYQEQWVYNEWKVTGVGSGASVPDKYVYFDLSGTVVAIQD